LGSRDVFGHVIIQLPEVDFLWVVHSDHASILHRYGDMAPQILDARIWSRKERKTRKEKEEGGGKMGEGKWKKKRRERRKRKGIKGKEKRKGIEKGEGKEKR